MANTAKNTSVAIRQKMAVEMRAKGMSLDAIAVALTKKTGQQVSSKRVGEDIRRWLRAVPKEDVDTVRNLELHRLDTAITLAMRAIAAGDLKGIDGLIKLQERRSKYLGLDQASGSNDTYSEVDQWLAGVGDVDFEFDPSVIGLDDDDNEIDDLPDDEENGELD
ncbi:hypothetical protein FND50_12650 [Rhodococcus sp. WB9]|uniref:hypothetical protein n=1 Tax=Rhodococcus sp. WB9 TaxID=2594007 RepID=UPI001185BCB8|nr:hypothetical protein [Rhodococcus sp. WB9]QDQ91583.1 hypothetical protein FND50_12650 [Rhodococcus sp. WB9]